MDQTGKPQTSLLLQKAILRFQQGNTIAYFVTITVAAPFVYLFLHEFPWETHTNLLLGFLYGYFAVILLVRFPIFKLFPSKGFFIQTLDSFLSAFLVFMLAILSGGSYSPFQMFYVTPIAISFFTGGTWLRASMLAFVGTLIIGTFFYTHLFASGGFSTFHSLGLQVLIGFGYLIGIGYISTTLWILANVMKDEEKEESEVEERVRSLDFLVNKLREIDKQKTESIRLIAHHFRTPLSRMKWGIDILLSPHGVLTQEQRVSLEKLSQSNEELIVVLQEILDSLQWETSAVVLSESVNISSLLAEIIAELRAEFADKHIIIEEQIPARLIVQGNEGGMRLVFEGIIGNAFLYNKQGGSIEVRATQDSSFATIIVKDTGIGIPEEDISQIFTAFFRARNARMGYVAHRGIALFFAKKIMDAHKGTIALQSVEGQGTTFTIRLPNIQQFTGATLEQ